MLMRQNQSVPVKNSATDRILNVLYVQKTLAFAYIMSLYVSVQKNALQTQPIHTAAYAVVTTPHAQAQTVQKVTKLFPAVVVVTT